MHDPRELPEQAAAPRYVAEIVSGWDALQAVAAEWDALADDAIEPSPSSERWMLLPSLRVLTGDANVRVVLVRAAVGAHTEDRGRLCAVAAIETRAAYHGLPVRTYRLWTHLYSLLPAPLLRAGTAGDCIRALLAVLAADAPGPCFVEFPDIRADSEFFHELAQVVRVDDLPQYLAAVTTRAVFRRRNDADRYLQQMSTLRLRRYERRLSEQGRLTYDELADAGDAAHWLDDFIALEMSGWKGREGTAFGCHPDHRAWLLEVASAAAERGRLLMLALRLDGRPIAMKLDIVGGPGGYAFKTAFDERHAKYSPGMLLELEHIRRLHAKPEIAWMDSLAGPEHALANRIWRDRTAVVTLLVAPARFASGGLLALVPLLRWLKRRFRRSK